METPTQEIAGNTPESKEKALELIQSIIQEYDEETRQIIDTYLDTSDKTIGEGKMQNDTEQRKVLIPVVDKIGSLDKQLLSALEEVKYSDDEPAYITSIRSLYGLVSRVKDLLQKAPDIRYSKTNLAEGYGGKEKVPAGTMSYEHTNEAVQNLQSTINGIKIGLGFMKE